MVLASGSGLDRYISVESAMIQVPRIAKARNISESSIKDLIQKIQETPFPWNWTTNCKCLETKLALMESIDWIPYNFLNGKFYLNDLYLRK